MRQYDPANNNAAKTKLLKSGLFKAFCIGNIVSPCKRFQFIVNRKHNFYLLFKKLVLVSIERTDSAINEIVSYVIEVIHKETTMVRFDAVFMAPMMNTFDPEILLFEPLPYLFQVVPEFSEFFIQIRNVFKVIIN